MAGFLDMEQVPGMCISVTVVLKRRKLELLVVCCQRRPHWKEQAIENNLCSHMAKLG